MKVLVCVQSGSQGELLLQSYIRLFYKQGDEVVVLHVARKAKLPTFAHGGGIGYVGIKAEVAMRDWWQKIESTRKSYEKMCSDFALRHKVIIKETEYGIGESIVETAAKFDVDMIVIGSKRHGFLGRIFLGSVDDYIKTHSALPMLACPVMDV